jgi:hypothetical protein
MALVLMAILPVLSQTIPAERWQKYSSPGGFSILMPGEAHESTHEPPASPLCKKAAKSYAADVSLDEGYFSVVSCVYSQPIFSVKDASADLDQLQTIAAHGTRGRVISQEDGVVAGLPARRISIAFEINGTPQNMEEMLVLAATRLFHLVAMEGQRHLTAQDFSRFFDSFSVLPESAQVPEKPREKATQIGTGITYFECPTYPAEARVKGLQGQVFMYVTTNGKKVTDVKASGDPELAQAAERNIRTWKFTEDAPKTFSVKYSYVEEGLYEPDPVTKCDAKMELPIKVQVSF